MSDNRNTVRQAIILAGAAAVITSLAVSVVYHRYFAAVPEHPIEYQVPNYDYNGAQLVNSPPPAFIPVPRVRLHRWELWRSGSSLVFWATIVNRGKHTVYTVNANIRFLDRRGNTRLVSAYTAALSLAPRSVSKAVEIIRPNDPNVASVRATFLGIPPDQADSERGVVVHPRGWGRVAIPPPVLPVGHRATGSAVKSGKLIYWGSG